MNQKILLCSNFSDSPHQGLQNDVFKISIIATPSQFQETSLFGKAVPLFAQKNDSKCCLNKHKSMQKIKSTKSLIVTIIKRFSKF